MCDCQQSVVVTAISSEKRLDRALHCLYPSFSRSRWSALIRSGYVYLNGVPVREPDEAVRAGDVLSCLPPIPQPLELIPENIPLNVLFEDESVLVLDKPASLCVHPAPGHTTGTLVNALLHHCGRALPGINGVMRPGIVHRLDMDTSGILVVAKTEQAQHCMVEQFASHEVDKEYLAMAKGVFRLCRGRVDAPIGRHPMDRKRMAVVPSGRSAQTRYVILDSVDRASLVRLRIETGRTHQIRVHLAHIGHPIIGDPLYSRPSSHLPSCTRQMLHAAHIRFSHPTTGKEMEFFLPPPEDFLKTACTMQFQPIPDCLPAFEIWMKHGALP